MLAPVEEQMSDDLKITKPHEWFMVNTFFLLGVALSPLFLAPLSEVYGRKPILIIASSISAVWLAACGAAQALDQMLAFRALSGFGASVADALAGGVLNDLWAPEERGTAFAVFMCAPLLGPGLGPILGGFVSEGVSWRWIFWVLAIANAVCIFSSLFLLHEMYEPRLEEKRRKDAKRRAGVIEPRKTAAEELRIFAGVMRHNLQRPFRMLATQIIVQILAVYMGILYGICFLFMYIYPRMWTEQYGQGGEFEQPLSTAHLLTIAYSPHWKLELHIIFSRPDRRSFRGRRPQRSRLHYTQASQQQRWSSRVPSANYGHRDHTHTYWTTLVGMVRPREAALDHAEHRQLLVRGGHVQLQRMRGGLHH